MRLRRRAPFAELVERQLDLFAVEDADLLEDAAEAERRYDAAARDEAEDAYGAFQLALEACVERLEEMRDAFARTLAEDAVPAYGRTLARAAARRWPALGPHLDAG